MHGVQSDAVRSVIDCSNDENRHRRKPNRGNHKALKHALSFIVPKVGPSAASLQSRGGGGVCRSSHLPYQHDLCTPALTFSASAAAVQLIPQGHEYVRLSGFVLFFRSCTSRPRRAPFEVQQIQIPPAIWVSLTFMLARRDLICSHKQLSLTFSLISQQSLSSSNTHTHTHPPVSDLR